GTICPSALFPAIPYTTLFRSLAFVVAQIGGERLAAPRHLARVNDRCERRYRAEALRIAKRHHQRAVAAHRVSEDRLTIADAEVRSEEHTPEIQSRENIVSRLM